jgi:UDP-N-acetylglucosamine diphosphorylase/glucosamine-1-phosphate N-acetyltransferase
MTSSAKAAIVLAAGKGKRMKSDLPKVLHTIGGRPMIQMVLDTLVKCDLEKIIVVVGYEGELVEQAVADYNVDIVWQREQLGTGHAVMMAEPALGTFKGTTLVALGDVPFLSLDSIEHLFDVHQKTSASATCLSAILDDPTGYGRVVRGSEPDSLMEIVEHKDADETTRKINEINSGTFCFDNQKLFEALKSVDNDNSLAEYYLTDTIKLMHNKGLRVSVTPAADPYELEGVNSVEQLEKLARHFGLRAKSR